MLGATRLGAVTIVIAVAAAIALIGLGITVSRQGASEDLEERLERYGGRDYVPTQAEGGHSRRTPGRLAQAVEQAVAQKSFTGNIRVNLARADLRLTVGEWLVTRLFLVILGFVIGVVLGQLAAGLTLLIGLVGGVVGFFAPGIYLSLRIRRRVKAFVNQLSDTITLMANSLRAGYSLLQTMEMVSKESPPPISDEFRRVVHEVGLGISHQEAMAHLLRRIPSDDLDLLISAINIQYEVGGNLAQILDVIGHTIRERVRIKGEIGVLTAQQTISGYIISALPVVLGIVLFLVSPGYVSKMFVIPWICMPIGSAIMIVAGFFVMKKITAIEV
jgi:tight adherence protein B